ncbi:HAD hydrolase-like protein [Streptomyces hydrogenans]|uniref:HAD hydrolase-like protein n=1 Tax=Streptomyces hydrogenans TaxID=1873719 RepID=UPI003663E450
MTYGSSYDRLVLWDIDFTLLNPGGFGRTAMLTAFEELFGFPMEADVPGHGRTDRAILTDFLEHGGIPVERVGDLQRRAAEVAEARAAEFTAGGGHLLDGAHGALAALAEVPGTVQSVLTGNLRRIGMVKLSAVGLRNHLDLEVASFGDDHLVRAELVEVSRERAAARHGGADVGAVVLVGDTPLDVEAALAAGARAVGVATGAYSEADLAAAGAHAVVPDLRDAAALAKAVESVTPRS